ncbi:MAG: C45 family peptidase [Thermoplasmatota archaeon]
MKKKIAGLCICFVLISTFIPLSGTAKDSFNTSLGGWLEEINGVPILHLSGSHYEMGFQHGRLLEEEIKENMRGFIALYEKAGWSYEDVLEVWTIQQHYLPMAYKDEMQGMADAINVTFEQIAVHNTWMGVFNHLFSCWGASLWGDATENGDLLHMRSVDGVNTLQDPVTNTYVYENQVIIVRNPDDAYASITPVFAGDILSIGGFNEQGVGVSELTIIADDTTFHGINAGFRMRMVLDYADNGAEAVQIMNSNRTCCWNFIVSDAAVPMGFAIEQSANYAFANTWFDTVESTEPFWEIKDVVRRGNCYIHPTLAGIQRDYYDPSGIKGYLRVLFKIEYTYINWVQYKAISEEIEHQYGTLTTENALGLLRNVYLGKTNFMFRLFLTEKSHTGRQWVGCPETGNLSICFAENGKEAYQTDMYSFNFYDLLNDDPP